MYNHFVNSTGTWNVSEDRSVITDGGKPLTFATEALLLKQFPNSTVIDEPVAQQASAPIAQG